MSIITGFITAYCISAVVCLKMLQVSYKKYPEIFDDKLPFANMPVLFGIASIIPILNTGLGIMCAGAFLREYRAKRRQRRRDKWLKKRTWELLEKWHDMNKHKL